MCDDLRTSWLCDLIALTGNTKSYAEHLLLHLELKTQSDFDLFHQFDLAKRFYEMGFPGFRSAMAKQYGRLVEEEWESSSESMIECFGMRGIEIAAKSISDDDESYYQYKCATVFDKASELLGKCILAQRLEELSMHDARIRSFMNAKDADKSKVSEIPKRVIAKISMDEFLLMVEEGRERAYECSQFGREAGQTELRHIFNLLRFTEDEKRKIAYLRVFKECPLPEVSPDVIKLIDSSHERLRSAAAMALSNSISESVREKAVEILLKRGEANVQCGLKLLRKNFRQGDVKLILPALKRIRDLDRLHNAGFEILELAEETSEKEISECLIWLYENVVESLCRSKYLTQLIALGCCPREIIYEAQWDAGKDVRLFARGLSKTRHLESIGT